ncbi:hypothetical protein [Eubacterium sp. An3]|uniref:hypothetical protein n=1 Tax=Eubacterium sp. An3 TaxID=1965628 RepID=UPI000B381A60|nr:hypothetical protein [Eubacterium sp. An3]OUO24711.1 hypothetical protein B5F87_19305 [Eubacterium sp. An3]
MKAKEVKRNVMKGLCLIAVLSAILLFYKVLYEQLSYTVAHLIDMFTLPVQIAAVCAVLWFVLHYKVDLRAKYEPAMKGENTHSRFLPANPFLDAFGESWREEYLPSNKQVGKYRYKAYWNAKGDITILVRECGHDNIIYCSSCHPTKALGLIEDLNQGELPADFGKKPVKVPEENLESIDALC